MGHFSSVPSIWGNPRILDVRIEIVITSWYIVPIAPRRCVGDISVKYIGAKPAFKPINTFNSKVSKIQSYFSVFAFNSRETQH